MAQSLNKVQLIGRLGRDAEMRYVPSGQPVTNFSVATSRSWKNKQTDEWDEETEWSNCTVWGQAAERAAEQLRKGYQVYIEGRLKTTKKEIEGQPGKHSYYTEIVVDHFINLTSKDERAGYGGGESQYTAPVAGFGAPEPSPVAAAPVAPEGQFRAPAGGFGAAPKAPAARPATDPRYDNLDDLPF